MSENFEAVCLSNNQGAPADLQDMSSNPLEYAPETQVNTPPTSEPVTETRIAANVDKAIVARGVQLPEKPYNTTCSGCNSPILTDTEYKPGALTWIVCVVLICCGCFLGCCLIPFCLKKTRDVVHKCPRCKHVEGQHRRI